MAPCLGPVSGLQATNVRCRGSQRSKAVSPSVTASPSQASPYDELAAAAGAETLCDVGITPLGRGLVARTGAGRQPIVSVPVQNALVIADEPLGLSIFSDRQQRAWQAAHGEMPEQLLEFLQGLGGPMFAEMGFLLQHHQVGPVAATLEPHGDAKSQCQAVAGSRGGCGCLASL